jgi:parallel beta-helix repeat protein
MPKQGFNIHQSKIFNKTALRAVLSATLLVGCGAILLKTKAIASPIAQIVVPTVPTTTPSPTPSATPTPVVVPTSTPSTTPTSTPSPTPTPVVIPTTTPTATPTPVVVPTPRSTTAPLTTPTATPSPTTNQSPTSGTVLYVDPVKGADSATGSAQAPYKTISSALNQAQSGTVVQLAPGTYSSTTGEVFPLTVKSGVTLLGDESTKGQTRVIIGSGNYVSPTFARQNVTVRAESGGTVSGVTIANPSSRGTGLWIESANPIVKNNTFTINNRDGIFLTGNANPTIENNVFTQNSGNGISVAKTASGQIRNNLFLDTGFGLAIGGTSTPEVAGNQLYQNRAGLFISDSARPSLRGNFIENSKQDGVVVTASAQPDLGTAENPGNNFIRNNTRYDVYNSTRSNTITAAGNDIEQEKISGNVTFAATTINRPAIKQGTFRDIQGYWAQPYIEALIAKDVIAGFPDGSFKPTDPVTRAQFATIISKAFAPPSQRATQEFKDVKQNFWAYGAIQTAYKGGFVAGYPGGLFQPQQAIPRVQSLVSLANGLKLAANNPNALATYADADQVPKYAADPVSAATVKQLVVNYPIPTQLNPNRDATRAEVAAFVYQALVSNGRAQAIASPYIVRVP